MIRQLITRLHRRVTGTTAPDPSDYIQIDRIDAATPTGLEIAWQSPDVASGQLQIVERELADLRAGRVAPVFRAFADAVLATGLESGTLVEVGCGTGHYRDVLRELVPHALRYVGVDYSPHLAGLASRRQAAVVLGSASALPMATASVDVLVSGCVLLHMANYETAVAESVRVAREWVIFHRTPVVAGPTTWFTKLAYGVRCIEIAFGHAELDRLFTDYGLRVERAVEISRYTLPRTGARAKVVTFVCRKTGSAAPVH
jgi:SAM-dependent methyltransferase